jgi:hypothetical protein
MRVERGKLGCRISTTQRRVVPEHHLDTEHAHHASLVIGRCRSYDQLQLGTGPLADLESCPRTGELRPARGEETAPENPPIATPPGRVRAPGKEKARALRGLRLVDGGSSLRRTRLRRKFPASGNFSGNFSIVGAAPRADVLDSSRLARRARSAVPRLPGNCFRCEQGILSAEQGSSTRADSRGVLGTGSRATTPKSCCADTASEARNSPASREPRVLRLRVS